MTVTLSTGFGSEPENDKDCNTGQMVGPCALAFNFAACAGLDTTRKVYVNGEKMGALGVAGMDQQTGRLLPDGRYWLEPVSGNWGIEGNNTLLGNVHATNAMAGPAGGAVASAAVAPVIRSTALPEPGRDASGNHCAFFSLPNGESVMSCGR